MNCSGSISMESAVLYGISAIKFVYPFHNDSKFFRNKDTHFSGLGRNVKLLTCSSPRMVSNGYVGRNNSRTRSTFGASNKHYERLDSCLVISPPYGRKPRAVVKFLGGAFIGAVPEVSYSYLLELLAAEGYLVVSVPYNVTFDHAQAAREIYERFHACVDRILTSGLSIANLTASEFVQLPFYSVGHRFGERNSKRGLVKEPTGEVW